MVVDLGKMQYFYEYEFCHHHRIRKMVSKKIQMKQEKEYIYRTGDRSGAPTLTPLPDSSTLRTSGKARRRSLQYFLWVGQSRCWHDIPQYLASCKHFNMLNNFN